MIKTFEEFKLSLPNEHQFEVYQSIFGCFDVVRAKYLIQKHELKQGTINVKAWAKAQMLDYEHEENVMRISMCSVDEKRILNDVTIDPSFPVIFVEYVGKKKNIFPLMIDGNHRLRKAFLNGAESIPAYYLEKKLVEQIKS